MQNGWRSTLSILQIPRPLNLAVEAGNFRFEILVPLVFVGRVIATGLLGGFIDAAHLRNGVRTPFLQLMQLGHMPLHLMPASRHLGTGAPSRRAETLRYNVQKTKGFSVKSKFSGRGFPGNRERPRGAMRCRCARVRPPPCNSPPGCPSRHKQEEVVRPPVRPSQARAGGALTHPPSTPLAEQGYCRDRDIHSTPKWVPATCFKRLIS